MTHITSRAGLDRLHQAMESRVARGELPGMVTLIAHDDDVHVDTIGVKAFGSDDPMQRDTIFRVASMTKPILAAATMMLVEDGKLALEEPVYRLLPELVNRRVLKHIDGPLDDTVPANRPITVEDLLTFRMGHGMIFEPSFQPPYPVIRAADDLQLVMGPPDPRTPHSPDEWIRRFATLPVTPSVISSAKGAVLAAPFGPVRVAVRGSTSTTIGGWPPCHTYDASTMSASPSRTSIR
jgi:CubicO group peptidase (beta-lactamase class C family)